MSKSSVKSDSCHHQSFEYIVTIHIVTLPIAMLVLTRWARVTVQRKVVLSHSLRASLEALLVPFPGDCLCRAVVSVYLMLLRAVGNERDTFRYDIRVLRQ